MIYCWKKYLMYLILYCSLEKMDGTVISSFHSPPKTVCVGQSENVLRESQAFELLAGDGTSKVKVLSLNYNINHNTWIWQISSLLFAKLYYFQWNSSIFVFFAEKRTLFSINSIRFLCFKWMLTLLGSPWRTQKSRRQSCHFDFGSA